MVTNCKDCGRLKGKKGHICPTSSWNKGKKWGPEVLEKMRLAKLGKPSPWAIGNKHFLGRHHSEETKEKQRLAKLGNQYTFGRVRPVEERKRMSEAKKGDKCYLWKGGKSSEASLARSSLDYRLWKEAVLERDNYTCVDCGASSVRGKFVLMHADHIKPFSLFPELRFAIDNGRTLCVPCHSKTPTYMFRVLKMTRKDFVK